MSPYDPTKHHRRSIRLKGYDYSRVGAYFITTVVKNRECILSEIRNGDVVLSVLGEIVNRVWNDIPKRFPSVTLDAFAIMPNHIHGILILTDNVGATLAVAQNGAAVAQDRARASLAPTRPTLGNVVGVFKSLCTTTWLDYIKRNNLNIVGKFCQRNYYEHIVRNEMDLNRIREYIALNPARWESDRENLNAQPLQDGWLANEKIWFSQRNLKND